MSTTVSIKTFATVRCVKVDAVKKKKSGLENLNSEIGSKVAENTDRWLRATMSSSPCRGGPAPFSRYTRTRLYTVAAVVQWVAAGYSGLHDAFDRAGLAGLAVRR